MSSWWSFLILPTNRGHRDNRGLCRLERHGAPMAQCTVTLDAVVVGLNAIEQAAAQFVAGGESFAVSELHLQRRERSSLPPHCRRSCQPDSCCTPDLRPRAEPGTPVNDTGSIGRSARSRPSAACGATAPSAAHRTPAWPASAPKATSRPRVLRTSRSRLPDGCVLHFA